MLQEAIKLLKAFYNRTDLPHDWPLMEETIEFLNKAEHYKPTVYITIRGGNITEIEATEEIVVSKYDYDLLEDENNTTEEEWTRMIESGLNSGQLVNINY